MAYTPENSSIKNTPEVEEALKTASFEEIKAIMSRAAVDQGLVTPDRFDPNVLLPTELATALSPDVDGCKNLSRCGWHQIRH